MNPSHLSSSSSPSSTTPKNKKKEKGFKDSSPPRLDPFSPGTNTSNLKVLDPISGLQFLLGMSSGSCQRMSLKQQLLQSKDPPYQVLTTVVRCSMWFKMKHGKTTCDANRPKDMEEYGFEVPERLRETLTPVALHLMQVWSWLTLKRRVCRPHRLEN